MGRVQEAKDCVCHENRKGELFWKEGDQQEESGGRGGQTREAVIRCDVPQSSPSLCTLTKTVFKDVIISWIWCCIYLYNPSI